jgi:glutathione synthase/RimK-type ligase-like ATP-grasp enzyme
VADLAILTCQDLLATRAGDGYVEQVHREDGCLSAALQERGLTTVRVDWADPAFDWRSARAALFRSTWDYFHRVPEFRAWLARIAGLTRLINPAATVAWNLDKRYLLDLQRAGVAIPETVVLLQGAQVDLPRLLDERGWPEAVIKPVVSGAARATSRVRRTSAAADQPALDQCLRAEAMLVQPFVEGVLEQGEVSVMVIDGAATHAVRKVAKPGDFRVQDDHGGTVHEHAASAEELAFATRAVASCGHEQLYARVDMARDAAGSLRLMELELIEPELFFRFQPNAADRLAEAVARVLSSAGRAPR